MNDVLIGVTTLLICFTSCDSQMDISELPLTETFELDIEPKIPKEQKFDSTFTIPSLDEIPISARWVQVNPENPTILLCHQATYNRHEYDEIIPELIEMGYNCMAIDQRSGGELLGYENLTAKVAAENGFPTDYVDAEQDMVACIQFLHDVHQQEVILWGSSYSAGLALHIASDSTVKGIKALIAFSPGDYYGDQKPPLQSCSGNIEIPTWITSSRSEFLTVSEFASKMTRGNTHIQYIPKSDGKHGSKALWKEYENNEEYWTSVLSFLEKNAEL